MPGFLLHVGATVTCVHGGQAQPTVPNPRVTVSGQPTVTIAAPYVVAGCALPPPPRPDSSASRPSTADASPSPTPAISMSPPQPVASPAA